MCPESSEAHETSFHIFAQCPIKARMRFPIFGIPDMTERMDMVPRVEREISVDGCQVSVTRQKGDAMKLPRIVAWQIFWIILMTTVQLPTVN